VSAVDKNELSFGYTTLRAKHKWKRKWNLSNLHRCCT